MIRRAFAAALFVPAACAVFFGGAAASAASASEPMPVEVVALSSRGAAERGALLDAVPGVRMLVHEGRPSVFFGKPMLTAPTADLAASRFLAKFGGAFGVGTPDLRLVRADLTGSGKFAVFAYQQYLDGAPVEFGLARVVVRIGPDWKEPAVVMAAAKLAAPPEGFQGFAPDLLSEADALALARAQMAAKFLAEWTKPEAVVFYGEGDLPTWIDPVRAWKVTGTSPDGLKRLTWFIGAADGAPVFVRDEVVHADIEGVATGYATPNLLPDMGSNPPAPRPLPALFITAPGMDVGSQGVMTDALGAFLVPYSSSSPTTVRGALNAGRYVTVNDMDDSFVVEATAPANPPGIVSLVFNPTPSQNTTSQVNAFFHTNIARSYFRSRAPTFTPLDTPLPANVNRIEDSCNANYTGVATNYYRANGACTNTAFSTVIAHEYGHHIVNRLGLAQGAFGEGFADTIAMFAYDTSVIGQGMYNGFGFIRNPETADQRFPCTSPGVHACGQILGGVWRTIRLNLTTVLGSAPALDYSRQLHVDWALITLGGQFLNSAHPQTLVEVLTVDDDNGDLADGTPNFLEVCGAFSLHGIDCGPVQLFTIQYPEGRPETIPVGTPGVFPVRIFPSLASINGASASVTYRVAGATQFLNLPLTQLSPGEFEVRLPGMPCGNRVEYFLRFQAAGGIAMHEPLDSPALLYSAISAAAIVTAVDLDFETDPGWTTFVPVGTPQFSGQWQRGSPVGGGQREDPPTDFDGSGQCWLTSNTAGNSDIDGGPFVLTTSAYDLSGLTGPRVSYARWYQNDDQRAQGWAFDPDRFISEVSSNDGQTWAQLESIGHMNGWHVVEFNIADFVPITSQMRFRFTVADIPNNSIAEAAIDAFRIVGLDCTPPPPPPPPCAADFNGLGGVTVQDIYDFFLVWRNELPGADFNGVDGVTVQDVYDFLAAWTAGCP